MAAMAIQNAVHRVHLASAPPTTVMTGSTTQIMIDLADLLRGETEGRSVMIKRLRSMSISVAAFALGCAACSPDLLKDRRLVLRGAAAPCRDQLPPGVEEAESSQLAERGDPNNPRSARASEIGAPQSAGCTVRSLIEMAPHSPARTRARESKKTQRYLPSAAKSPPMPMPW